MALADFLQSLKDEVKVLLDPRYRVDVTATQQVPNVEDQGFNLGTGEILKAKTLNTCVLFIDIRKSTQLNLVHSQERLARLYAAFIKSMLKVAERHGGKVRNINGDRIMVVFDTKNCFINAISTAALMNTVSEYIINKHFTHDTFKCGIGIDYGPMLVVKTGTVKQGDENQFYKSFVWLGKPANLASKLTDLANKEVVNSSISLKYLAYNFLSLFNSLGPPLGSIRRLRQPTHTEREIVLSLENFADSISKDADDQPVTYKAQKIFSWTKKVDKNNVPPILITEEVYDGLLKEDSTKHLAKFFSKQATVVVSGYAGGIYGSSVYFSDVNQVK